MLLLAQEHENFQSKLASEQRLFGSLEQGLRGNMVAGSLTQARFDVQEEYRQAMFPYIEGTPPPPSPDQIFKPSGLSEEDERKAFLADLDKLTKGQAVVASFVHSSPG